MFKKGGSLLSCIYKCIFPPIFIPFAGINSSVISFISSSDFKSSNFISLLPIRGSFPVASSLSSINIDGFKHKLYKVKVLFQRGVKVLLITFVFWTNS